MGDILVGVVIGAGIAIVTTALTSLTDLFKGIWSARRQTASWRRQTMFQVTHDYIESAFALSGISSNVREFLLEGATTESIQALLDECRAHHSVMMQAMSALRLVAPKRVINAAEAVHDSSHKLVNSAVSSVAPSADWMALKTSARTDRENLIVEIRKTNGLGSKRVSFSSSIESSWKVPSESAIAGATERSPGATERL